MLTAALLLCLVQLSVQQSVQSQFPAYDIDWNVVPEANAASIQLGRDLTANCICDLTRNVCDVNCCCDDDCDSALVESFKQDKGCLPAGPPEEELQYCLPKDQFARVNLPSGSSYYKVTKKEADNLFLPQLLCIATDRNPNLGDQLADPQTGDVNAPILASACTPLTNPTPSSSYSFEAAIPARRSINGGPVSTTFTLPYPAFSSQCSDVQQIGYLVPLPSNPKDIFSECDRIYQTVAQLQSQCTAGSVLAANAYTSYALGQTPADTAYRVSVQVQEVQFLNQTTGVLSTLATTGIPSPTWDGIACHNVVSRVSFVLTYQSQQLVVAQLSLVLTDVAAANIATTPIPQKFRVQWIRQDMATSAVRMFSGNPGYQRGLPVLAGVLTKLDPTSATSKQAILRFVEGLPLLQAGAGGSCQTGLTDGVPFGANASSSCLLPLTLAQLQAFCTSNTNQPAQLLGSFYSALLAEQLYLGVLGDADSEDVSQWVPVRVAQQPALQYSWSSDSSTCSNVLVGFEVQIVTALTQAANNLQPKILYASVCFKFRDWRFYNPQTPAVTQNFVVEQRAVFVPKEQRERKKGRKRPPLVARLPEDLFYPFVTSDTHLMTAAALPLLALVALATAALLL